MHFQKERQVLSTMKNLKRKKLCTIDKTDDCVTDGKNRVAPNREVILALLKQGLEFGLMKKHRDRSFFEYDVDEVLTNVGKKVARKVINRRLPENEIMPRMIKRKPRRKKRRVYKRKYNNGLRRSPIKPAVKRLQKVDYRRSPNSYRFFELYVNPNCRVSAKSSAASTHILEQEESENCV